MKCPAITNFAHTNGCLKDGLGRVTIMAKQLVKHFSDAVFCEKNRSLKKCVKDLFMKFHLNSYPPEKIVIITLFR